MDAVIKDIRPKAPNTTTIIHIKSRLNPVREILFIKACSYMNMLYNPTSKHPKLKFDLLNLQTKAQEYKETAATAIIIPVKAYVSYPTGADNNAVKILKLPNKSKNIHSVIKKVISEVMIPIIAPIRLKIISFIIFTIIPLKIKKCVQPKSYTPKNALTQEATTHSYSSTLKHKKRKYIFSIIKCT